MNFRVTARDNRASGGGDASDDMVADGARGSGPFAVTQPNTAVSLGGRQRRRRSPGTWPDTTSRQSARANVKISLSTDGGN